MESLAQRSQANLGNPFMYFFLVVSLVSPLGNLGNFGLEYIFGNSSLERGGQSNVTAIQHRNAGLWVLFFLVSQTGKLSSVLATGSTARSS